VRTAIIIAIGFAFLGACLLAPRLLGRPEATGTAARIFLQGLPISLLIFIVPGAVAAYVAWKYA
jgi:hypothetical protein